MIAAGLPTLPPNAPFTVPAWPRGTMAAFMLQALTHTHKQPDGINVARSDWAAGMAQAESWATRALIGTKTIQRTTTLHIAEDTTGNTVVWWGDGSALVSHTDTRDAWEDRMHVVPVVFQWNPDHLEKVSHLATRPRWEELPETEAIKALIQSAKSHRFTPTGDGTLAAWADLDWVSNTHREEIRATLLQCACWMGTRSGLWPTRWLAIITGRAVASDGTLSEPHLQWGAQMENDTDRDKHANARAVYDVGTETMRRWIASPESPLHGIAGVCQGFPMGPNDCTGDVVADLVEAPTNWSAHARIALAETFERRFSPRIPV